MSPRQLHNNLDTHSSYGEKLYRLTFGNKTNGAFAVHLRPVKRLYGSSTVCQKTVQFIYSLSEGCMVCLQSVKRLYSSFTARRKAVRLTTSLEHCLEGNTENTLGGISYIFLVFYSFISCTFLLCFTVLLKQLRRLYTGGFIFQVPPVSD
jgi:hypothetical protein